MFDLTGRNAFVAGGCGIIGSAICHDLASQGANVLVADVDTEACSDLVTDLKKYSIGHHRAIPADLTSEDGIQGALHESTPPGSLHIIVHCLGIISSVPVPGYAVPFEDQTLAAWELALKTNLTSAFLLAQHAHPLMEKEGRSSVVFLSSIYGTLGPNWSLYEGTSMGNPFAYGASKGGLEQLMRYLATRWAPGIRVNCVAPGGIRRGQPSDFIRRYEQLTPLKRMADPVDVSGPVVFLASDAARYITGQTLMVDGGWSVW